MNTEEKSKVQVIQIESTVSRVLSQRDLEGFQQSFLRAAAIQELRTLLNDEYMKPIMAMQGSKLGFKADKVYDTQVVRECLIEAVLTGVQPYGNQFNIIAGNAYITKEGFGYLLSKYEGLSYTIVPQLPRISQDKTSAAIMMQIKWKLNGREREQMLEIPVKMNNFMGTDAVIGKATRKARAWLWSEITGSEVGEGDVDDTFTDANVVGSKTHATKEEVAAAKENERLEAFIKNSNSISALDKIYKDVPECLMDLWRTRRDQLSEAEVSNAIMNAEKTKS
jgi:hypothetical protein